MKPSTCTDHIFTAVKKDPNPSDLVIIKQKPYLGKPKFQRWTELVHGKQKMTVKTAQSQ
jgi:hypothetical protein